MMKVLVTGAKGMLGCRLVPYLRARGIEVVETSRAGPPSVAADLADSRQIERVLGATAPDVIVNLAALTNVDECERQPQRAYLANVLAVENLARWIRESATRCRLVHISTDQVYDGMGPHAEDAVTLTNYYGFSKYAGELAASTAGATILRTNFFGRSNCPGRSSLSDWIVSSLSGQQQITVFDDIYFSPLSLPTLVAQIERVVRDPRAGVFNLGSRNGVSKAEFAFAIAGQLGLAIESMKRGVSTSVKLLAYRPKDMRMNSQRFESEYGIDLPTLADEINLLRGEYLHEAR